MLNDTIRVQLFKRRRPLPGGGKASYWILKWTGSDGRPNTESLGRVDDLGIREAKGKRAQKESDLNAGSVPRDNPDRMTLADFATLYIDRRRQGESGRGFRRCSPRLEEGTIAQHIVTLRYMRAHFGDDRAVNSLDSNDAEDFLDALASGKLASASKVKRAAGGMANMRKHVRIAKGIFSWAKRSKIVNANPFDDFDGNAPGCEASPYVTVELMERVIAAMPNAQWKALFALCRFAGLRVGEAISLQWSGEAIDGGGAKRQVGVDWAKRRIALVAEKTKRFRIVPVTPRLHAILTEAQPDAPVGSTLVCGEMTRDTASRCGARHIANAGVKAWRKLFHALRASCENDLKVQGIPEATYAAWLGHSPQVSRKHYVAPVDAEFEQVTKLRLAG